MEMILRVAYSVVLVALSGVLLRELWTVWMDPQVYVGQFEVVSESAEEKETGANFAKRIVNSQAVMSRQIAEYQSRGGTDAPTDITYLLGDSDVLKLPPAALEGIDITIQSVNLREVLSAVRKQFRAPNEVHGHVTIRPGSVLTAVEWPHAPRFATNENSVAHFITPSRATPQESAGYVACSILWARAAAAEARMRTFSRAQICDFATALDDLYALGATASQPAGLSDAEAALVRVRAAQLRTHYSGAPAGGVFPELYRLRADLLDLLPEKSRTQEELVQAQEDRLRYAMLSPTLRDLPDDQKRLTALALARPAIQLTSPLRPPQNWSMLLTHHESTIRTIAASTGLVVTPDGSPVGTGFIVAPGLMLTASFVVDRIRETKGSAPNQQKPARLCLGLSAKDCEPSFEIGSEAFRDETAMVSLLELPGHDPLESPPLSFLTPLPEANAMTGRYAFVVGYPFRDDRMPKGFLDQLLGQDDGRKRVMPGRILAFGPSTSRARLESTRAATFTTDISTTVGTGGGPLVDLSAGLVIGVSYGGEWRGERGKFANANPLPAGAIDLIRQRTHGQADATAQSPKK